MGLPIITHSVPEGCISIELVSSIEISVSCLVVGEIPTYKDSLYYTLAAHSCGMELLLNMVSRART